MAASGRGAVEGLMTLLDTVGPILIGWSALSLLLGLGWSRFMQRLDPPPASERAAPPRGELVDMSRGLDVGRG